MGCFSPFLKGKIICILFLPLRKGEEKGGGFLSFLPLFFKKEGAKEGIVKK
jgi:hypothetical protein